MKELYESRILEYSRTLFKGRSYADYLEENIRSDKGYDCYKENSIV